MKKKVPRKQTPNEKLIAKLDKKIEGFKIRLSRVEAKLEKIS